MPSADVTRLLARWSEGDADALQELMPLVYAELRRIAVRQLRRERQGHTLEPTALVNEVFLRLVDQRQPAWENRAQFFAIAARLMRRVLVDYARARGAAKRGGSTPILPLDDVTEPATPPAVADILDIDAALTRLSELDPDQGKVVELRFFGGLSVEETAHVLQRSPRTIKREWRLAKAWLHRELQRDAEC
jgi:RNA polymerase sigma factor (TIGR02999 family)